MAKMEDNIVLCAPYNFGAAMNMLIAEIIGTFVFISTIMSVAFYNGNHGVLNALAIGGTLFGMV